jgi:hypothetical protein
MILERAVSILTIPRWYFKYYEEVNGDFLDLFYIRLSYILMLLGQSSISVASIMRQALVAGSVEVGFRFLELYRMIFDESVIGYHQILRSSEANMQLIFFLTGLSGSADLSNENLAKRT